MTREASPAMPQTPAPPRESTSFLNTPLKGWSSASVLVLTGFGAFFFFLISMILLSRGIRVFYEHFGLYSATNDVQLWRFMAFSLLSFVFNVSFSAYFGILFARGLRRNGPKTHASSSRSGIHAVANWGLIALAVWFLLFNIPTLAASLESFRHPSFLYTKVPLIVTWPPLTMPYGIRVEFALFCPMGNIGIFFGFSSGVLFSEMRRLRALAPL